MHLKHPLCLLSHIIYTTWNWVWKINQIHHTHVIQSEAAIWKYKWGCSEKRNFRRQRFSQKPQKALKAEHRLSHASFSLVLCKSWDMKHACLKGKEGCLLVGCGWWGVNAACLWGRLSSLWPFFLASTLQTWLAGVKLVMATRICDEWLGWA